MSGRFHSDNLRLPGKRLAGFRELLDGFRDAINRQRKAQVEQGRRNQAKRPRSK
jgi:hypothetical protein